MASEGSWERCQKGAGPTGKPQAGDVNAPVLSSSSSAQAYGGKHRAGDCSSLRNIQHHTGGSGTGQHHTRGRDTLQTSLIFPNRSNQGTGTPAGWDWALGHESSWLRVPGENPHSCDMCCRVLGACAEGTATLLLLGSGTPRKLPSTKLSCLGRKGCA